LISRDDSAWIMARVMRGLLLKKKIRSYVTVWVEGEEHIHNWAEEPPPMDVDDMPW